MIKVYTAVPFTHFPTAWQTWQPRVRHWLLLIMLWFEKLASEGDIHRYGWNKATCTAHVAAHVFWSFSTQTEITNNTGISFTASLGPLFKMGSFILYDKNSSFLSPESPLYGFAFVFMLLHNKVLHKKLLWCKIKVFI